MDEARPGIYGTGGYGAQHYELSGRGSIARRGISSGAWSTVYRRREGEMERYRWGWNGGNRQSTRAEVGYREQKAKDIGNREGGS